MQGSDCSNETYMMIACNAGMQHVNFHVVKREAMRVVLLPALFYYTIIAEFEYA